MPFDRRTQPVRTTTVGKRRAALVTTVTLGAILLFVGTASTVMAAILQRHLAGGVSIDRTLTIALILNIAVILFGWQRYRDMQRDLLDRDAGEARAHHLMARDSLTGLLNRRGLIEQGAAMIAQAQRRQKAVALLMFDLDHFKNVNDLHGHGVGDALLRQVAGAIAEIMPPVALTARLGGDEFACAFLFDTAHADTVDRLADRLMTRLTRVFDVDGLSLPVAVSLGIARGEEAGIDTLMRCADIAMYAAKSGGRGRSVRFDQSMERDLRARNELETALRDAVTQGHIVPYFEQQIDLLTGELYGLEVLARWHHPDRGLIEPDQFIPVAEEIGLITDLSMLVMRQAFTAARDWHPSLRLSVNISPAQIKDPWLAQKMLKLLAETGFPASRVELEITEAALFDNLAMAQNVVAGLKNQGMRVALDDFGTGYSSLAHLRALPFDRIKIDHSFVLSMADNAESAAIVTAIARLSESLNLPIAAEGIADAATVDRLRGLGFTTGQGYHFGRPTNLANTRRLLADRSLLRAAA